MREVSLEELLEAGCHFGHQVIRSNPKARDFVFEARDNIQIIDLVKTKEGLDEAAEHVRELAATGGNMLIVGTKRQAQPIVKEEFERVNKEFKAGNLGSKLGLYFVAERWVGGILTNFSEVSKNIKKLKDLKGKLADESEKSKYTKKEVGLWDKEMQRLQGLYGGISDMDEMPNALFIVDSHLEELAVKEAQRMNVETIAIVDTNADSHVIDYPIPANDDAVGSIKLITAHIMDAWIEGKKQLAKKSQKEEAKKEKKEVKKENGKSKSK